MGWLPLPFPSPPPIGWSTGFMTVPRTVGRKPRHEDVADLQPVGRDDVALLAVAVEEQRQVRRAIRIVLDGRHSRRDPVLLSPEIDIAQHALVPTTPVAHGDAAVDVAAARPPLGHEQALLGLRLRDVVADHVREIASRRRRRFQRPNGHAQAPSTRSILWPGASCTTAFFQSERRPWYRPMRFSLPS